MRPDLLALTADDLASFSNRGLTRRAQQEAASGALTCEIDESRDGSVCVRWSDGIECRLPAGARLRESRCTCPSTTLCRHVLRSVFAYQRHHGGIAAQPSSTAVAAASGAWNPAAITEAQLAPFFSPSELARWRREFAAGHVVQVWTGPKPRALLHTLGCTVNFRVPNDLRYAACDCAAEAPCGHVALAVWAFRLLPLDQPTGLVSTAGSTPAAPVPLLDEIEAELTALAMTGLARAPALQVDRWRRLSERARSAALVWPAEVLRDIAELHAAYLAHDARFDPREFLALAAELVQRCDAIRAGRTPVPALFVRGTSHDRETELGSARLIGLGCMARTYRGGTELSAHLQDSDSGAILAVARHFPDPPNESGAPPRMFAELARTIVLKGASLAALGRGQLLVKGGRRTPSGRFLPGRAPASVSPQAYAWEALRAPLRAAGFEELREQLRGAPPVVLGPRQMSTRLTVCPVASASDVEFSAPRQEIVARLTDASGEAAWLAHPFLGRGAAGSERLLHALRQAPAAVRFVCAQARLAGPELILAPLSVVFGEAGGRNCVQPWVDEHAEVRAALADTVTDRMSAAAIDPLHDYLEEMLDLLAESWLTGTRATAAAWPRLAALGSSLGLTRLAAPDGVEAPAKLLELTIVADFAHREFARLDASPTKKPDLFRGRAFSC